MSVRSQSAPHAHTFELVGFPRWRFHLQTATSVGAP